LTSAPKLMKARHIRLELAQEPCLPPKQSVSEFAVPLSDPRGSRTICRAVGWQLAGRAAELGLAAGTLVDVAYRIRENDHPEFGGLEIEIAGIELSAN
jgi:single-stranded-DNA-specific exonuclease